MAHNGSLSSSSLFEETTQSHLKRLSKEFLLVCVPVLFTLAFVNNSVVLYAFGWPRRVRLRGATSMKLYYSLLAAADLLVLAPFACFMLGLWLPDSLRPFFRHNAGCKTAFYLGYVGESCSQWLLVALCAERLAALCWPLWSRRTLSFRCSLHICECIIVACAIICLPVAMCFQERENSGCGNYMSMGHTIYGPLMAYVTIAQKYAYATLAMLALSAAIAVKLLLIGRNFRRACALQNVNVGSTPSEKNSSLRVSAGDNVRRRMEVSAAFICVVLALLQTSLYLPRAILYGYNVLVAYWKTDSNLTILDVANVVDAIGLLVHTWNLYVYLLRVPELRDYLRGRLCCEPTRRQSIQPPAARHASQPAIISANAAPRGARNMRTSSASPIALCAPAPSIVLLNTSPKMRVDSHNL